MRPVTDGSRVPLHVFTRLFATIRMNVVESSTPQPLQNQRVRFLTILLLGLTVCLGFALRTTCFLRNQSLWIDEAMLAINVVERSPGEFFEPLDFNQSAPVGYLLLSKGIVETLGTNELALRLPSFMASMTAFVLFIPFAWKVLPRFAAHIAIGLFSLSPYLVGYSAEFKQYELDAMLVIALNSVGIHVIRESSKVRHGVLLALLGTLAIWFSHPSTFALGTIGTIAGIDALIRRDRRAFACRMAMIATWLISWGLCYYFVLRKLEMNAYLMEYWSGKFLPFPPQSIGDLAWIPHHFLEFFGNPGGFSTSEFPIGGLAAFCLIVGGLSLAKEDWRKAALFIGPLLLALLASGFRKYPFAGRLLLFAVPLMILLVSLGASLLVEHLNRIVRGSGLTLLAILFLAPIAECRSLMKKPLHDENSRAAIDYLHQNWHSEDRLYIYHGAKPAFLFYHRECYFFPGNVIYGTKNAGGSVAQYSREFQSMNRNPRVWVLMSHKKPNEEIALQTYLDTVGTCTERVQWADATLLRYDLSRSAVNVEKNSMSMNKSR